MVENRSKLPTDLASIYIYIYTLNIYAYIIFTYILCIGGSAFQHQGSQIEDPLEVPIQHSIYDTEGIEGDLRGI